jgi:ribonuclease HI
MKIELYSDGSGMTCNTDGGYGWVMVIDGVKNCEGSGHLSNATNNDCELEGAIRGLAEVLKLVTVPGTEQREPAAHDLSVTLVSDSMIVLGWANGTYKFKQESKLDKYKQLQFLVKRLNVQTRWVKGHAGDPNNIRCDKLANLARKNVREDIDKLKPIGDTKIGTKKNDVVCLWRSGVLKIVDLENNIVEDYNRELHGKRGSLLEIREGKDR